MGIDSSKADSPMIILFISIPCDVSKRNTSSLKKKKKSLVSAWSFSLHKLREISCERFTRLPVKDSK